MSEQFSANVREVVERSEAEASSRQLPEVTSELVLLALTMVEGTAAHVLRALNITPERLRDCMPVAPSAKPTPRPIPFGESAVRVINAAHQEAVRMGHSFVGTEHVLLGALGETSGRVPAVLNLIGRDAIVARERLLDLLVSPGFVSPESPRPADPATATSPLLDSPPPVEHREFVAPATPVAPDPVARIPDDQESDDPSSAESTPMTNAASAPEIDLRSPAPNHLASAEQLEPVSSNGHATSSSSIFDPNSSVTTALIGELVLLRTEIAALRAEIVSMRSVRH